jgi:hypothetical protein
MFTIGSHHAQIINSETKVPKPTDYRELSVNNVSEQHYSMPFLLGEHESDQQTITYQQASNLVLDMASQPVFQLP